MPNSDPVFICQSFQELSNDDLYDLLKLRSDVFVIEQDCLFPDMDDCDQDAMHLLMKLDGVVLGYARLLPAGSKYDQPSIGRVVTAQSVRRGGYGRMLLTESIKHCRRLWPESSIVISAQERLENFYQGFGFVTASKPYLEDGISHLEMHLPPAD